MNRFFYSLFSNSRWPWYNSENASSNDDNIFKINLRLYVCSMGNERPTTKKQYTYFFFQICIRMEAAISGESQDWLNRNFEYFTFNVSATTSRPFCCHLDYNVVLFSGVNRRWFPAELYLVITKNSTEIKT